MGLIEQVYALDALIAEPKASPRLNAKQALRRAVSGQRIDGLGSADLWVPPHYSLESVIYVPSTEEQRQLFN